MNQLHVLTAVSRPGNLPALAESLSFAAAGSQAEIIWHWRFDLDQTHVGGQQLKNEMLDGITGGYVWVLDDDTLVHPDLFRRALATEAPAVVVSQQRTDGRVLHAHPDYVCPGQIDIGQAVLSRELIGRRRIPLAYDGDGAFLQTVLAGRRDTRYIDEILSFHNSLELAPV